MQKQKPNKFNNRFKLPITFQTILHTHFLETEKLKPKSDLDTNQLID